MIHGILHYKSYCKGHLMDLCILFVVALSLVSLQGCHSSRKTVAVEEGQAGTAFTESSHHHSKSGECEIFAGRADSTGTVASEHADVLILRDSLGRVVGIHSTRFSKAETKSRSKESTDRRFHEVQLSQDTASTEAIYSRAEETKETATEVKTGLSLRDSILGLALLVIFICAIRLWGNRL